MVFTNSEDVSRYDEECVSASNAETRAVYGSL
jgi:hypothetical protein